MSDLESDFYHQEAMYDEDMPALFQYFTKVSLLLSSTIPPSFSPYSPTPPVSHSTPSCVCLLSGGAVWRGVGRPGPKGPQPAPVHPAGAEGRPPREEWAQGQSLPAAGGTGLLQKVLAGQDIFKSFYNLNVTNVDNYDIHLFTYLFINCSDETEDDTVTPSPSPSPELRSRSRSSAQPESGIKRLYVTISFSHSDMYKC